MRRPFTKRLESDDAPSPTDSRTEALLEQAALAKHLHEQGVNPVRWTKAHPAPQSEQVTFRKTGIKPRGNQFEVAGKLYNWSDEVKATPAQATAIGDAYIAERTGKDDTVAPLPKIEDLVDIAQVPLKHPLGRPHIERPAHDMSAAEERAALIRHYAQSGVDPDRAHLGDPVNMKDQERLKAALEKIPPGDKSEIGGLAGFYQGFDDGWIYQTNEYTRPRDGLGKIKTDDAPAKEDNPEQHTGSAADTARPQHRAQYIRLLSAPEKAMAEYQSAIQGLSKIAEAIDDLKAGKALTVEQTRLKDRTAANLQRVGIKVDFQTVDADLLHRIAANEEKYRQSLDTDDIDKLPSIVSALGAQVSEVLAGGNFNAVRMHQAGSWWERLALVPEMYSSFARLPLAKASVTPISVEGAKAGPVDYEAVMDEMKNILVDIGLTKSQNDTAAPDLFSPYAEDSGALAGEETPASAEMPTSSDVLQKLNATTFVDRLPTFDEVTIQIGDVLIKQHPLTTATDQIFIEEFIEVAKSRGCEPDPEPTPEDEEKKAIHGGDNPQRRISDIHQPGHRGSGQPDGDITMSGHGNKGAVFFNSVSTHSDGLRILAREIAAAKNILRVMVKQAGMDKDVVKTLTNPVKAQGPLLLYRKQWGSTLEKIRQDLRSKIRKAFDQYYENCLPKGPPEIVDLDGIGD